MLGTFRKGIVRAVLSLDAVATHLPSPLNVALDSGRFMTFQDGDLLSGLRIPDARGAVSRRGHHLLAGHADPIDDLLNDRVSLDTP